MTPMILDFIDALPCARGGGTDPQYGPRGRGSTSNQAKIFFKLFAGIRPIIDENYIPVL
jgi:hypothetical protein